MTTSIALLVLWLICTPTSYLLVRRDHRGSFGKWTQMDRLFWMSMCLLYGPIMLFTVAVIGLAMKLGDTSWAKREAQW